MRQDPLLGELVEIRSDSGIVYRGRVRAVDRHDEFSERFTIDVADSGERHDVYVTDRNASVRRI